MYVKFLVPRPCHRQEFAPLLNNEYLLIHRCVVELLELSTLHRLDYHQRHCIEDELACLLLYRPVNKIIQNFLSEKKSRKITHLLTLDSKMSWYINFQKYHFANTTSDAVLCFA